MKYRISEYHSHGNQIVYNEDGSLLQAKSSSILSTILSSTFLPVGYPHSVTSDYLSYQIYDSIQGLSSYIRGMLCSQAVLLGIGVGDSAAIASSAAMQLVFRDAVGLIGGLLFTALEGSSFDSNAKQWRITADVLNDLALTIELVAPSFPSFFLAFLSIASACRAVVGVAGAASRTALTQHFAQHHPSSNAADITAKEGAQETAITLLGMLMGVGLLKLAALNVYIGWISFVLLTIVHVIANIYALRCLCISRLNAARLDILLHDYFIASNNIESKEKRKVLSPRTVGALESLMPPPLEYLLHALGVVSKARTSHHNITMAPSLKEIHSPEDREYAAECITAAVLDRNNSNRYYTRRKKEMEAAEKKDFVVVNMSQCHRHNKRGATTVYVFLLSPLSSAEIFVKGFIAAWLELNGITADGGAIDEFLSEMQLGGWTVDRPALSQGSAVRFYGVAGGKKE